MDPAQEQLRRQNHRRVKAAKASYSRFALRCECGDATCREEIWVHLPLALSLVFWTPGYGHHDLLVVPDHHEGPAARRGTGWWLVPLDPHSNSEWEPVFRQIAVEMGVPEARLVVGDFDMPYAVADRGQGCGRVEFNPTRAQAAGLDPHEHCLSFRHEIGHLLEQQAHDREDPPPHGYPGDGRTARLIESYQADELAADWHASSSSNAPAGLGSGLRKMLRLETQKEDARIRNEQRLAQLDRWTTGGVPSAKPSSDITTWLPWAW